MLKLLLLTVDNSNFLKIYDNYNKKDLTAKNIYINMKISFVKLFLIIYFLKIRLYLFIYLF